MFEEDWSSVAVKFLGFGEGLESLAGGPAFEALKCRSIRDQGFYVGILAAVKRDPCGCS